MAHPAAVALVVVGGGIALVVLAKKQGLDLGSEVSNVVDKVTAAGETAAAQLGLSNDPLALALPIIKNFEGFSANAYEDPPGSGKYSIGYGHQIQPGESYTQDSVIAEDEGSQLLRVDAGSAYICVTQNVQTELNPQQAAALISFCYNIGCGAFGTSTMVNLLNQGDMAGAADQFPAWIHAGGTVSQALVDRRNQEQELFNS